MKENACSVNHFFAVVVLSLTVASGWEYGEYGLWCYTYNRNTYMNFWPTLQMERDRGSRGRECRTSHSITTCLLGIDPWCVVCVCVCVQALRFSWPFGVECLLNSKEQLLWNLIRSLSAVVVAVWFQLRCYNHKKLVTFLVFERHFHKNKNAFLVSIWQLNQPLDWFIMVEGPHNCSDQSG